MERTGINTASKPDSCLTAHSTMEGLGINVPCATDGQLWSQSPWKIRSLKARNCERRPHRPFQTKTQQQPSYKLTEKWRACQVVFCSIVLSKRHHQRKGQEHGSRANWFEPSHFWGTLIAQSRQRQHAPHATSPAQLHWCLQALACKVKKYTQPS